MSDDALSREELQELIAEGTSTDSADNVEQIGTNVNGPHDFESTNGFDPVVRSVSFGQLGTAAENVASGGVGLIMDVNVQVSVELGRSVMKVRDVLGLGPGSVVELDKHAGEPVEVVVNNKMVARGEVVVIDENFGVRITEIINGKAREADAQAA
ncbi:MAG: flagellar motor switch protein FliN [Armatimonadota bacterium]|jgi:flagellar motor switch protein FliN